MASRLWDKGENLDREMHELTVGEDPILDRRLVRYDAMGSAAHARMLAHCGYLSEDDCAQLVAELSRIAAVGRDFEIPRELEDVHSAIENELVNRCGEPGRRIHTARSRNDQVVLALRLFMRAEVHTLLSSLEQLTLIIAERFTTDSRLPLPGYTHMQPAMPSSVGMWLHSLFEGLLESMRDGHHLLKVLDQHPLGSGAGFGSSLPIDREYAAKLLGFSKVQRSFIDVNNSRGRYELKVVRWCVEISTALEKFASDCMLFLTKEFGFISLPKELTTGSSIMPQKRNPDLVELLRGRVSTVRGAAAELDSLTAKLPSSYHRDFQLSKAPLIRGLDETKNAITSASLILKHLKFDESRLRSMMHPELYATYDANREVAGGRPFRDAYRDVAARAGQGIYDVKKGEIEFQIPQGQTENGFKQGAEELQALIAKRNSEVTRLTVTETTLFKN